MTMAEGLPTSSPFSSPGKRRRVPSQQQRQTSLELSSSDDVFGGSIPASPLHFADSPVRPEKPTDTPGTTADVAAAAGGQYGLKFWLKKQWNRLRIRCLVLKRLENLVLRVPPRVRMAFVVFWFAWKVVLVLAMVVVFLRGNDIGGGPTTTNAQSSPSSSSMMTGLFDRTLLTASNSNNHPLKVLYIVTSLAEYNNGRRSTIKGQDRFLHQMIPVLMDGVETMVQTLQDDDIDLQVDVFLICAYQLRPERERLIRERLRAISQKHSSSYGIGFQFWDNATPLGYTSDGQQRLGYNATRSKLRQNTRALARQHRYVTRDKLPYYDLFLAFEDDMRITRQHVQHFWRSSLEIERLRVSAPVSIPSPDGQKDQDGTPLESHDQVDDYHKTKFFGHMTKRQLERVIPGFFRVEALTNETRHRAQEDGDILPLAMDYEFDLATGGGGGGGTVHRELDPSICCHVTVEEQKDIHLPEEPPAEDLVAWETNVMAFSIREFPPGSSDLLQWTVLMLGPEKSLSREEKIGGYWSGRDGAFTNQGKPRGAPPQLLAQQGGWMATKEQLIRMNNGLCKASFLPPFDNLDPMKDDGLEPHNVEFWSGGYQFFTGGKNHCNMQRVISMHPDHFSKHLVYHAANNKQKQLPKERIVRANHMFGQLNTAWKNAKRAKGKLLMDITTLK